MALIDSLDKVERREISKPTKMVVVADGDIIKNELDRKTGKPLPLGLNTYSNKTFANKGFLINTIEWLLDDFGIVNARNKEVKMRLLNPELVESEEGYWQILNIALPLMIVLILGLAYTFFRRKRYA